MAAASILTYPHFSKLNKLPDARWLRSNRLRTISSKDCRFHDILDHGYSYESPIDVASLGRKKTVTSAETFQSCGKESTASVTAHLPYFLSVRNRSVGSGKKKRQSIVSITDLCLSSTAMVFSSNLFSSIQRYYYYSAAALTNLFPANGSSAYSSSSS